MFSALAAVCTVDCAIEIVLITLHYNIMLCFLRYWILKFSNRCLERSYILPINVPMSLSRISPSSTLPPDSCSQPGAPNASSCFSVTVIGCGSRNGFNSVSTFWHTIVLMDQRHYITPRAFVGQPMWKVVDTSAHLPPWCLLSHQCSNQLLVTVPFQSVHCGHGTVYHLTSELFHPSPPFDNNWRHICSGSVLGNFLLPSSLLL